MDSKRERFSQAFLWFLPTGIEFTIYLFLTMITVATSNLDFVKNFLYVTDDVSPIGAALASINGLVQHVVGERVAGSLSLAIFWGLIGLFVNVVWWVGSNFSTELNNDLVFSKYVHPKSVDQQSPMREFIKHAIIRTTAALALVFYANFFVSQALPRLGAKYRLAIQDLSKSQNLKNAAGSIFLEILMLHLFVVLARLIVLRKQIFSK